MQEPAPGQIITHFRIIDRLGAGGMGVVYKAEDLSLGRLVALKFLPFTSLEPQAAERFMREARTASTLNHPNICTIYGIDTHEGRQFIAMELLEGQTLLEMINGRPLDIRRLCELGMQLADALDVAHARGILHRDIKPANIFVTTRGQLKVLDFGLAKLAPQHRTAADDGRTVLQDLSTTPGMSMGTVAYMSPEQARAEQLDVRSDLFSAGVVLYEMATGARTFAGLSAALIFDAILNRMPPSPLTMNPMLPPEVERIIGKALEKDRELRYQSAADLRADLQRLRRALDSGSAVAAAGQGSGWTTAAQGPAQTGGWPGPSSGRWQGPETGPLPPMTGPGTGPQSAPAVQSGLATAAPIPASGGTSAPYATPAPVAAAPVPGPPVPAAVAALPKPAPARPATGNQKNLIVGAAAAVVVLIGIVGFMMSRGGEPAQTVDPAAAPTESASGQAPEGSVAAQAPGPVSGPASGAAVPPGQTASNTASAQSKPAPGAATVPPAAGTTKPAPRSPSTRPEATPAVTPGSAAPAAAAPPAAPAAPAAADVAAAALDRARTLLGQKQQNEAITELRQLVSSYPTTPAALDAQLLIGQVYEQQNRLEEALAIYGEARKQHAGDSRTAEVLLREARVLMRTRRPDRNREARSLLAEASDKFPGSAPTAQALTLKAQIEERDKLREQDPTLGNVPAAIQSWRTIAERYPSVSEQALTKLKDYYEDLKRYDLAAQTLADLAARFPVKYSGAWFEAGELYERRLKDPAKAIQMYSQVPARSDRYRRAQDRIRELGGK